MHELYRTLPRLAEKQKNACSKRPRPPYATAAMRDEVPTGPKIVNGGGHEVKKSLSVVWRAVVLDRKVRHDRGDGVSPPSVPVLRGLELHLFRRRETDNARDVIRFQILKEAGERRVAAWHAADEEVARDLGGNGELGYHSSDLAAAAISGTSASNFLIAFAKRRAPS